MLFPRTGLPGAHLWPSTRPIRSLASPVLNNLAVVAQPVHRGPQFAWVWVPDPLTALLTLGDWFIALRTSSPSTVLSPAWRC